MNQDLWHVQLASGERRVWTLDQLDAAYRASLIDEETFVCEPGSQRWATLGEVAGAGAEDAPPEPQPVSIAPPPVEIAIDVAPPAYDDLDDLELAFGKKRSKKGLVMATLALALVGGAAFTATKHPELLGQVKGAIASGQLGASVTQAAAAAPSPVTPTPAPSPSPVAKSSQSAWTPVTTTTPSLSEDQKRALLDADKKREAEQDKKKAERAKHAPHHKTKTGNPFHKGGDSHDPLNSSL